MGLSSVRERSRASGPHGYQSTGLCACWRRYGLVSSISLFVCCSLAIDFPLPDSDHLNRTNRLPPLQLFYSLADILDAGGVGSHLRVLFVILQSFCCLSQFHVSVGKVGISY